MDLKRNLTPILRAFNIEEGEYSSVALLFLHHFFQGFAISLVFIVANALFLNQYSIKELPYIFIGAGALTIIGGRIYAYFEHHLTAEKLLKRTIILMIIIVGIEWMSGILLKPGLFAFTILLFYYFLYLLSNLEFWGLSALLFDVRQSKRLFGLISAGDMPAKMLGYLTVSILAAYTPLHHLMILSIVGLILSFVFLSKLLVHQKLDHSNERDFHHQYAKTTASVFSLDYLKGFFLNRFIIVAAILSFISILTLTTINFSFLAEVKYKFKTDKELASFFGFFFASGQLVIILLKFFFSGRFIQWTGIKRALSILPVSIILILIGSLSYNILENDTKNLIYVFGFLMLSTEILNYSLQQPLFLSLFQPLNHHLRLHGHTVIKGFVNGIAMILSGFIILILLNVSIWSNLLTFGILILVLAILWLLWVFKLEKAYHRLLGEAVRTRRFTGIELQFEEGKVVEDLINKLQTGKPWEILYCLDLLKKAKKENFSKLIPSSLLRHNSPEVRTWLLQHSDDNYILNDILYLKERITAKSLGNEERRWLIKKLSKLDPHALQWAQSLLEKERKNNLAIVIEGLLQGSSIEGMVLAGNKLMDLKESGSIDDKLVVCQVIADLELSNFHSEISQYLRDDEIIVKKKAIETAAKIKNPMLIDQVTNLFKNHFHEIWYLEHLASFEEKIIPKFCDIIDSRKPSKKELESMIFVCKNIVEESNWSFLLKESFMEDSELRISALNTLSLHKRSENFEKTKDDLNILFKDELQLLSKLLMFEKRDQDKYIKRIINIEKDLTLRRIFSILKILYPDYSIQKTEESYLSGEHTKKANAIEMMDEVLENQHKKTLLSLLENKEAFIEDIPANIEEHILETGHRYYCDWSIGMCIQSVRKGKKAGTMVSKWENSSQRIIREQAEFFKNKNYDTKMKPKEKTIDSLSIIEKISLLKSTDLFKNTPENLLVDLAGYLQTYPISKGDTLFNTGDPGDKMYIIYSGSIEIRDDKKHLATFSQLDFFGELSLLDDENRSASAIALEDSMLLAITQEDFYELISFRPEVAKSILRELSKRLRRQNKN